MAAWSTVEQALVITVIGVSSIFVVLIVMWGLMAALVRFTAPRPAPTATTMTKQAAESNSAVNAEHVRSARRHAAVAAIAVALALEADRTRSASLLQPARGAISAWQATLRGNALSRRAGVFRRNPPPRQ